MLRIYADEREIQSGIPSLIKERGATVILQTLSVGDYIAGEGVAIERKSVRDLVNSVFDKRFFDQLSRMTQTYPVSFLLIEGDMGRIRQITEKWKAINGAVLTAILDFKVSVIYSGSKDETAEIIVKIAGRFQTDGDQSHGITLHDKRKLSSLEDFQEYILESFPSVGSNIAKKIMEKFNSIEDFCNASVSELERAVGSRKRAEMIYLIIHSKFKDSNKVTEPPNNQEGKSKSLFDFM